MGHRLRRRQSSYTKYPRRATVKKAAVWCESRIDGYLETIGMSCAVMAPSWISNPSKRVRKWAFRRCMKIFRTWEY